MLLSIALMRQLNKKIHPMKKLKCTIVILTLICLQTNLFADISPYPIKAKTIRSKDQTSIRMESEKVIIDLYNDSSVVKCSFNMKNEGEKEKLKIGFPEMNFYHYQIKSVVDDVTKFRVQENGKEIKFDYSDSLRFKEEYRWKVKSYQIKEEWYLWDVEFQKGESKVIDIQYSLPFGMLYRSNKRFFTYLLSTGANWKGTIGKAEIIVNLKDIVMDSIISQKPANCEISDKQLIWTFLDFDPTTDHDIKIIYNSDKILYKGKEYVPPTIVVNGKIEKDIILDKISPTDIACFEFPNESTKKKNDSTPQNRIVEIYTKGYLRAKLEKILNAKTKKKIVLPEYDILKKNYSLLINERKVKMSKISSIEIESIAKVEVKRIKDEKYQIKLKLRK